MLISKIIYEIRYVVPNMSFSQISEEAVMEVLNNLKQKLSCGHDGTYFIKIVEGK